MNYLGRVYGAGTDWVKVIQEAAKHRFGPSWLRSDLDVASGLADLAEQMKGTTSEGPLADAALAVVEAGNSTERAVAWQLPWERATHAVGRLLKIVETDRERLEELRGVPNVIWRLLQAYPDDPRVKAALQGEANRVPPDPWILEMVARSDEGKA